MSDSFRARRGRLARRAGTLLASVALLGGGAATAFAAPIANPAASPALDQQASTADLAQYVNPFMGTSPGAADMGTGGGAGNNFPGADVPFGMVQWSPDTVSEQPGGYYYPDNRIRGFSLTHLSGAGCDTYEDIPFMPYTGTVTDSPETNPSAYVSTFSHSNESASPGYYGVTLDDGVKVELSATQRTGSGRFSYPEGADATLLVNPSGSIMGDSDAQITIGRNYISGYAVSGNFCSTGDTYKVYFYAQFDQNFASFGTWHNGTVTPNSATSRGSAPANPSVAKANAVNPATGAHANATATPNAKAKASAKPSDVTATGAGTGGWVSFDTTKSRTVNVRVGLSFVSAAGAKSNLGAENNGAKTFNQVAAAARASWNSRLGEIQVTGGTTAQQQTFYSSLYHALLQPNVFNDDNGQYLGFDGRVHTVAKGHAIYTNFSGWDVYRSEAQLLSLLAPGEMSDIANSMIQFAAQGGSWDRWTVANGYTGVMNGDPYHIIVADAYAFGANDFNAKQALSLMLKGATQPTTSATGYVERPGLADYLSKGYVPGAAADTLEYTSADFAIAQLAQGLGDSATHDEFMNRAQYWQNLFDPATGYLEPRNSDGSFPANYNPGSSTGYVEGNGAQYSWMVPYNEAGLMAAMGGDSAVNPRLDTFFSQLNAGTQKPYAFLSNEPTLETPWLYDFSGEPYQTQATVREVQNNLYNATPTGLEGNDDLGEMASWYVWSAIGLYPEIPASADLVVGSPMFTSVKISTPSGRRFTINAPGASATNYYVSGLKVNGKATNLDWLPATFAQKGGTLEFTLSSTPDKTWATAAADAPPSFQQGQQTAFTYADPAEVVVPAGGSGVGGVGAQDLTGKGATVNFTATPPAGLSVAPASGSITVPGGQKATVPVTVSVAAGTADGVYRIPISFTSNGAALPGATMEVLVAQPGSLEAAYDNVGISPDDDTSVANFDGDGFSYSADQLAKDGITAGGPLTVDGVTMTWPDLGTGNPDNVTANGQTIDLPGASASATKLVLVGAASNGDTSGTLTVTYTDGTTQTATIGFSDWTLGADGEPLNYGNSIVASTPYRNQTSGGDQVINTYVLATAPIPLTAGKTVASVTLPASFTGNGAIHVFALGVG